MRYAALESMPLLISTVACCLALDNSVLSTYPGKNTFKRPAKKHDFCTAIQKAFTKYCKQLDILQRGAHKARKTYISELIDHGININTIRAIAGHKDEHTTFNNYCYDLRTNSERPAQVIAAIQ